MLQFFLFPLRHFIRRIFLTRKHPPSHILSKLIQRPRNHIPNISVLLTKLRTKTLMMRVRTHPQKIMINQNLPVTIPPTPNPNTRHLQLLRHNPRHILRNTLNNHRKRPSILYPQRILHNLPRPRRRTTLGTKPPQRRNRLGQQPHVTHHRHTTLHNLPHRVTMPRTLEFHRVHTRFFHEPMSVPDGVRGRDFVTSQWHVPDE
mmetsp:Transcript_9749/g.12072  ORF Transcript_9749/g.12072 Transcript_9749/m.12072 type:complete len:203 (+) Transcript_9749:135-743(+)